MSQQIKNTTTQPIPVIILAGFLGSGKTTVLNHLLRNNNGRKIGVIVNDFGEVNIDSLLVNKQTENTMELSGGCICCQVGDGDLEKSLQLFTDSESTTDVIIIEASGIAEPIDLKKLILYSPNKDISLSGVVYIVDAVNFSDLTAEHPEINDHIASSDLIVINKVDKASTDTIKNVVSEVKSLAPKALILQAERGSIDSRILFDTAPSQETQLSLSAALNETQHTHLHSKFSSTTFTTKDPLSPKKFTTFLQTLPAEVYRMKGIIYYGMKGFEQKIIFHKVGKHLTQHVEEWAESETPSTVITAIGSNINKELLLGSLTKCIDPSPDVIAADDTIDIMRLKGF